MSKPYVDGPWQVKRMANGRLIVTAEAFNICSMTVAGRHSAREEANAALIAAAPDLLEAAKALIATSAGDCWCIDRTKRDCPACRLVAAIQAAEGGQS